MRGSTRRFIILLYCLEAGLVLLLAPWRPIWDRVIVPSSPLWWLWTSPWVRAATSGLGALLLLAAVHLVWEWKVSSGE